MILKQLVLITGTWERIGPIQAMKQPLSIYALHLKEWLNPHIESDLLLNNHRRGPYDSLWMYHNNIPFYKTPDISDIGDMKQNNILNKPFNKDMITPTDVYQLSSSVEELYPWNIVVEKLNIYRSILGLPHMEWSTSLFKSDSLCRDIQNLSFNLFV